MKLIVGLPFDFEEYTIEHLDELTDTEKYHLANECRRAEIYENTKAFLYALNAEFVDIVNLVWYEIEIL